MRHRPTAASRGRHSPLRRVVVATFALAALAIGSAEQHDAEFGGVAAVATEEAVLLRWRLPGDRFPDRGFRILRTGGGEEVQFDLPSPLPRQQAVAAGLVEDEAYEELVAAFAGGGGDEGAFARALTVLVTVIRPDYARVLGTLYEDHTARDGVHYRYRVETGGGSLVGVAEVEAGRVLPIPEPVALRADANPTATRVELHWSRPDEEGLLAAFHVYRMVDGQEARLTADPTFLPVRTGEEIPAAFVDEDVEPGRTYRYRVEGIDLFGRPGPSTDPVTISLPDPNPLPSPLIAEADIGDRRVTLRWSPVEDERVAGLGVVRARRPDSGYRPVTEGLPAEAVTFVDEDVRGGHDYYYALVTIDADGRRSERGPAFAVRAEDHRPPPAPQDVRVEPAPRRLTLRWTEPPAADVRAYRVYVAREDRARPERFAYLASTSLTFHTHHLEPTVLDELRFVVRAVSASGVEGPPSEVVRGRVPDRTPPPVPTIVRAEGGDGEVVVHWAPTNDPDVHERRLYRAEQGADFALVADGLAPDARRYRDENVRAGVRYRYRLDAVDASGNASQPSESLEATPLDFGPPEAVTDVVASLREEAVLVTWRAREGERYVVERARAGANGFVELHDPMPAAEYVDPAGEPGDRYRVFAVDEQWRIGSPSAPATAR